ncbi:hypothetical protein J2W51_003918 [Tardiphaga robiniae]|uniref:hypothetical protein n=1 Tax=Tardiphaga robiniae TaxID=943830 RepID=UPI0028585D51|nr:hypothetical protein [Tardiphaga robiniae]MDR6661332.1 hypothetical protein [Tardiphaga robiniae]
MMHIAHALTLREIESFKHLVTYDFELLVEKCRFGVDSVLNASKRVEMYLAELEASGRMPPLYDPVKRWRQPGFATSEILDACHLPQAVKTHPRVSWVIKRAECRFGLRDAGGLPSEIPPLRNLTAVSLSRWLDPIEALWTMRHKVRAEVFEKKPFRPSAATIAAAKGIPSVATPVPPPHLALHLFERSVGWVFDRSEALLAAIESRNGQRLRGDVIHMSTACWIVIAAFSARRDREIDELTGDCLAGSDASGWWLHVYIEKTMQRKDWIPIPNVVARAIEVQKAISAEARLQGGAPQIFQWIDDKSLVAQLDVGARLDAFAQTVDVPLYVPPGEEPRPWHWVPRQMRRFFAMLYFFRFDGASIEVLAHHLRHFNLETARGYVTQDKEVTNIWRETAMHYRDDFCRSIVTGDRAIGGKMGEKILAATRQIIETLRRKMQVVTPDHAVSRLSSFMQSELLVLSPRPWVTCSCPMTINAARTAACREGETNLTGVKGPNRANEGPVICHNCEFAIIEGKRASYVANELDRLKRLELAHAGKVTLFGDLERENVVKLGKALDDKYLTAKPLEPAFALSEVL